MCRKRPNRTLADATATGATKPDRSAAAQQYGTLKHTLHHALTDADFLTVLGVLRRMDDPVVWRAKESQMRDSRIQALCDTLSHHRPGATKTNDSLFLKVSF